MTTPKIVRSGLRIPMDLNTDLILLAQKKGISKNALMLEILWESIKNEPSQHEVD